MPKGLVANNLRIQPIQLQGNLLEFEIAWDHAWHTQSAPGNHDAVWLFGKYKVGNGDWQHLHFDAQVGSQVLLAGEGFEILPDALGMGVMLKNIHPGFRQASAQLSLRFLEELPASGFELRLFGIEMAWVSSGPFWLGDGLSNGSLSDAQQSPYLVSDESEIALGALQSLGDEAPDGAIPADFPKGAEGFYLMKYEVSQAQYADFLNTLNFEQQQQRTTASPSAPAGTAALQIGPGYRRNDLRIALPAQPGLSTASYVVDLDGDGLGGGEDGQHRACNWLSWPDLAAYLDWAALRPITELEFEKACRGPEMPVALEFAWGTDSVVDANTLLDDGLPSERQLEQSIGNAGIASHGYDGPQGPLRTGFAARDNSSRIQAGAGYFGHMELSGNLWEYCVPALGEGLQFLGNCGDGELDANGSANVAGWPQNAGFRGGGWNSGVLDGFRDLAVSDRFYISLDAQVRRATAGGRGAR